MWDGFSVVALLPSPKSHDQEVGAPIEPSVNPTVSGAGPDVGPSVNEACGVVGVAAAPIGQVVNRSPFRAPA